MGFMDNFTTDGMVEMKHTEYYNLMREAAKAELIEKAVKADVPGFYIQAMITGEKPEFQNTLEAEEESTGFGAEYEQMTGAAVSIFEAWTKENGVESAAASMHRIIDTLAQNRMDELKTMEANQKENEERMKEAVKEAVETMGHMPVISMGIDFGKGKEKQDTEEAACRDRVRGKSIAPFLDKETTPVAIYRQAIDAACEMVQAAAMLLKYEMSMPSKETEESMEEYGQ